MTKKMIALLLAVLMVLTLAACKGEEGNEKDSTSGAGSQNGEEPTLSDEENTTSYLLINYAPTIDDDFYLEVRCTRTEVIAEMNGEIHKVGTIDPEILFDIEEEMIKAGIMDMVGTDTYDDGDGTAAVYMEYTDGDQMMINFSGSVPEEFEKAYAHMEAYFAKLLKNAPDYVPTPQVEGTVDETQLNAVKEILTKANLENLDKYKIYAVPKDDNAPNALGLDSTEFMVSASACDSKMFEVPYNISVIQVNGEANIEAVRADLADGLRWSKYVHMPVDSALIAQKGDLVLCLMATGDTYQNTAKAIAECGWENVIEYKK